MSNKTKNQEVIVTDEQISAIKGTVVAQMSKDEIDSVITIRNIELGEQTEEEFDGKIKFGIKMPKQGRIPFEKVEDKIPTIMKEINEISGNPADILNIGIYDKMLTTKDKDWIEKIEKNMTKEEVEIRKEMINEIATVEKLGLKWTNNVCWDIWKIVRGRRQRKYLEKQEENVEFLIKLYSNFSSNQDEEIKNAYKARFQ